MIVINRLFIEMDSEPIDLFWLNIGDVIAGNKYSDTCEKRYEKKKFHSEVQRTLIYFQS